MSDNWNPIEAAQLLAALVDTFLPGDAGWPSGATVGVQAQLVARLVQERGEDVLRRVTNVLSANAANLLSNDEAARMAAVAGWEARDKDLFGWVRDAAYHAYYESPFVVQAINQHGHTYKLIPHLTGYTLSRFDPDLDTPRHGRGGWIPTGSVTRVAVETLGLGEQRTVSHRRTR